MNFIFFVNNMLIGAALSMDAFSVSVANSLIEPHMKKNKIIFIACIYAFFQSAMPIIGYICIHCFVQVFNNFYKYIPYISLFLLIYIGAKMIVEAIKNSDDNLISKNKITFKLLLLQGVATSIDALSVGFTLIEYTYFEVLVAVLIIGIVTFIICSIGLLLGKKIGKNFEKQAQIIGGIILMIIGIEIFVKGILF